MPHVPVMYSPLHAKAKWNTYALYFYLIHACSRTPGPLAAFSAPRSVHLLNELMLWRTHSAGSAAAAPIVPPFNTLSALETAFNAASLWASYGRSDAINHSLSPIRLRFVQGQNTEGGGKRAPARPGAVWAANAQMCKILA